MRVAKSVADGIKMKSVPPCAAMFITTDNIETVQVLMHAVL